MYDSSRGSPAPRSVSLVVTVLSKLIQATSLTHSIALAMRTHFCLQGFLELIARGSPQKSYPWIESMFSFNAGLKLHYIGRTTQGVPDAPMRVRSVFKIEGRRLPQRYLMWSFLVFATSI
ncbi:hypothetical protein BC629DRAFT_1445775 [Irpex lacteus]|nr:hypothetical protein BC629DRAFT_1445775 [Irpex lacteus]